jgi:polygalacturonase
MLPTSGISGSFTSNNVTDSSAHVTACSITVAGSFSSWPDTTTGNPNPVNLMADYFFNGPYTITFSNLAQGTYALYDYAHGNALDQNSVVTVSAGNGGASASTTANATYTSNFRDTTAGPGVAYVVLNGTVGSSGTFTFTNASYLNGLQLQLVSAAGVSGLTNQTVIAGNSTVLVPTVIGTTPISYQWNSNGVAIANATNSTLPLNSVQYAQNGTVYSLVASNPAGADTNSMMLTVIVTPAITGLNNQAAPVGNTVSIPATVSGVPTPAFKWLFNGNAVADGATGNGSTIAGSASSTLTINNAQAADSGIYSLVASNAAGVVTNTMTLTVSAGNVAPFMTGPTDQNVVQTSNATFTASVSGLPVPALQWRVNGANIAGATTSSLTISNVQYAQNGYVYSLVASNVAGMTTNSASLIVLVPPAITQQPTNLAVIINTPATFSVTASGVPAVKYQWIRNGSVIPNATNASYTISSAQGSDNGATFSVAVSNSVAVVTSSNGTLTVLSTMAGAFLPTNNATGISPDQQLRIVFSGGTPKLGAGKLYVRNVADDSIFATIDTSQFITFTFDGATVTNGASRNLQGINCYYEPIAIEGNVAWVTFTNRFAYNKTYYVTADAGLFRDGVNASFPAISGTNMWRFSTKSSGPATPTASTGPTNITVGLDGAGDFATLQGASDWIPQNNTLRRNISIQPGTYRDYALFEQNRNTVTISGAGASPEDVLLYYPWPTGGSGIGVLTLDSSDINVLNLDLDTKAYLTFPGRMRSLISTGNRLVFENVLIKGGQDTLYTVSGSAYFKNCEVWGSVDFIYGAAVAVFDQCAIVEIRDSGGPITAPNTPYAQPYGLVFLNCSFPQATIAAGHPYNVGAANTTFQRAWGQDGMTAIINCAVGSQISTAGWSSFGYGGETTCRAREYGTTLIGGGTASTIAQRQAAGAYWLNTIDPDYTNNPSLNPTNALLALPNGPTNRVGVTVNPVDYTLDAIFGHSYFGLGSWRPAVLPLITSHPTNQTVNVNAPASFNVTAIGVPEPVYQWLKNGANLLGQTNATLTFASVQASNVGTYSVLVSNSVGSVTSSNATLQINGSIAPVLTVQPTNQTVAVGGTAVFTVVASGVPAPTYQWLKNGTSLLNATNATLTLANVQVTDIGVYSLIAANSAGTATSVNAALTLTGGKVQLPAINLDNIIVVTNSPYNAAGDGATDNTTAIQNAINKAATGGLTNGLRGGTVEIPAGTNTYLCGPLNFSNNVNLQLDAGAILQLLPYDSYPGAPTNTVSFITGSSLTNIAITGLGMIDGQGSPWWAAYKTNSRPVILYLPSCSKALFRDFTITNPPATHIAIKGANAGNINFIGIKLFAPSSDDPVNPSHNTDGVDFAETNAVFQDCFISTGDDNIAMGSSGSKTADILITNCFFGEGHGCSIGSYTSGGVSNLTVISCTFSNTGNGIKVKSARDRGGIVQNLNYYNITMTNVDWPIQIYPYYEFGLGTLTTVTPEFAAYTAFSSTNPVPYNPPIFRNITISNVTANVLNGRPPLMIWGLPDYPVSNVVLQAVTLNSSSTRISGIYNVTNVQIMDCSFPVPAGTDSLQCWNADLAFTNSASGASAWVLDGITTNGVGSTFEFFRAPATFANSNTIAGGAMTVGNCTVTVSNNLALTTATPLNYVVGTNPATLVVKGNLTSGGIVNVAAGTGFTNGTYTLITYTGSLSGAVPALGTTPPGYAYSFDTATSGIVKLVVTLLAPTNLMAAPTNMLINLKWNSVSGATSYNLKRGTVSGNYPTIFSGLVTTNFGDANVTNAINYYYVVTATGAGGESSNSLQAVAASLPSNQPTNILVQASAGQMQLSWPQDHLGWRLQAQTNNLASGLGTNWVTVPNSTNATSAIFSISASNGSTFFRLVYP